MKVIHTADIHLDSPLAGVADGKLRRAELLQTVADIAQYALQHGVQAVVVAGDLFDGRATSQTVQSVADIVAHSGAQWFVLKGNHGESAPYQALQKLCNINLFEDQWRTYRVGNVAITGRELGNNDALHWQHLRLDSSMYNIVALHCDVENPAYGLFDGNTLVAQGANYVALGHRHAFWQTRLGKTKICYSGVPEVRGFDENTQSGFVVLDTDTDSATFVPHQIRTIQNVEVQIAADITSWQLSNRLLQATAACNGNNYLNLVLKGSTPVDIDAARIAQTTLKDKFFALRVKDQTTLALDLEQLSKEVSLRGEFVKLALQLQEEEQQLVLKLGLAALAGEL